VELDGKRIEASERKAARLEQEHGAHDDALKKRRSGGQ
jgi:hypothetical protein